jgi:hypothetical protein
VTTPRYSAPFRVIPRYSAPFDTEGRGTTMNLQNRVVHKVALEDDTECAHRVR